MILRLLLFSWLFCSSGAFLIGDSSERRCPTTPLSQSANPVVESPDVVINGETMTTTANNNATTVTATSRQEDDNPFDLLAGRTAVFVLESDMKRNAVGIAEGAQAPSATQWIDDATAYALRQAVDMVKLQLPDERQGLDRDEASNWIRFFKAIPAPVILDFSTEFRSIVNATLPQDRLNLLHKKRNELLHRVGCRLILLPSGAALPSPLQEFPNSLVYGKLLYGGVTRSRLLPSSNSRTGAVRAAGVRQETKQSVDDNIPSWMMFGGASRMYQAVDMGPAAVLEVVVMPQGVLDDFTLGNNNMVLEGLAWPPQKIFGFYVDKQNQSSAPADGEQEAQKGTVYSAASLSGRERNDAFRSEFTSTVGGLQPQIDAIVRRVLDGRVIRPADKIVAEPQDEDETSRDLSLAAMEAEELALLGLTPVRGLLLYGPPGTGKTALAREISRVLRARQPKIVSAPELLDRWVGGSEKLVRALFADAQAELAVNNGDVSKSALHVIVIDEIDAVFRKRSSSEDTGEATRASVVNQILSCLDGVNSIPNILMIGMTNRRELLDEALLRPGRLEVQIEIPLPDKEGRREILQIHFAALRERGRLSMPLCCAIDGVPSGSSSSANNNSNSVQESKSRRMWNLLSPRRRFGRFYDLAAATQGYSGADIAGLVRSAGSLALSRARRDGSGVQGLLITLEDAQQALTEVKR